MRDSHEDSRLGRVEFTVEVSWFDRGFSIHSDSRKDWFAWIGDTFVADKEDRPNEV